MDDYEITPEQLQAKFEDCKLKAEADAGVVTIEAGLTDVTPEWFEEHKLDDGVAGRIADAVNDAVERRIADDTIDDNAEQALLYGGAVMMSMILSLMRRWKAEGHPEFQSPEIQ